jgi:hypothetical protein
MKAAHAAVAWRRVQEAGGVGHPSFASGPEAHVTKPNPDKPKPPRLVLRRNG